nr:hypothetical protein [uncultured Acetatifactor sp.]
MAGRHLEKRRSRSQGFPESRVICGLEIERAIEDLAAFHGARDIVEKR